MCWNIIMPMLFFYTHLKLTYWLHPICIHIKVVINWPVLLCTIEGLSAGQGVPFYRWSNCRLSCCDWWILWMDSNEHHISISLSIGSRALNLSPLAAFDGNANYRTNGVPPSLYFCSHRHFSTTNLEFCAINFRDCCKLQLELTCSWLLVLLWTAYNSSSFPATNVVSVCLYTDFNTRFNRFLFLQFITYFDLSIYVYMM